MDPMGDRRRGVGLATTLSLTALAVLLAFVSVAACFAHLTVASRQQRLTESEAAADSVAQLATARLLHDPTFGTHGDAVERSLELDLPQGKARLTFDADVAADWGIPLSRNNLVNETSMEGYQRTIPPQAVQLLAQGQAGGNHRLIEVIVNQPPFKWAVASTGKVHSQGGLKVFGVKDLSSLAGGVDHVPVDKILPGHVASDSSDGQALQLDSTSASPSLVTGDAQAMGGVTLGPATVVNGQVKAHADPAKLPDFVVENYDPAGIDGLQNVAQDRVTSPMTVSGLTRRGGNLTVTQGGLAMDQGYLYVDGNLEVFGGLSGKGAIFATGSVTIHGMGEFAADNLQAIIAKGDLRVEGANPESSSFQGLLTGGGSVNASRLTLVGSLLGTSKEPGGSPVSLEEVTLVSNPQALHLDFPKLFTVTPPPESIGGVRGPGLSWKALPNQNLSAERFYDPVTDRLNPELATFASFAPQVSFSDGTVTEGATEAYAHIRQFTGGTVQIGSQKILDLLASTKTGIEMADKLYQHQRQHGLPRGGFSLDPNQFIQTSDKMRRLLWRVVP